MTKMTTITYDPTPIPGRNSDGRSDPIDHPVFSDKMQMNKKCEFCIILQEETSRDFEIYLRSRWCYNSPVLRIRIQTPDPASEIELF